MVSRQRVVVTTVGYAFEGDCPAIDRKAVFISNGTEAEPGADDVLQFHLLIVKTDNCRVEAWCLGCPGQDIGQRGGDGVGGFGAVVEETPFAQFVNLFAFGVPQLHLKIGLALATLVVECCFERITARGACSVEIGQQGVVLHVEQGFQQDGTIAGQAKVNCLKNRLAFLLAETERETVAFAETHQVGDIELGHRTRITAEAYQFVIDIEPIARRCLKTEKDAICAPLLGELVSLSVFGGNDVRVLFPVLHDREIVGRVVVAKMLYGVLVVIADDVGTRGHPQILHALRLLRHGNAKAQQQTHGQK